MTQHDGHVQHSDAHFRGVIGPFHTGPLKVLTQGQTESSESESGGKWCDDWRLQVVEPVDQLLQNVDPGKDRELWVKENKTGEVRPVDMDI